MARQTDKRLDVVDRLARGLKPGEYITNKRLVTELRKAYPEFGYRNPIVAADFSANCKSGYNVPGLGGSFSRRYEPNLFRVTRNRYVRYQPKLHGAWECCTINGKKNMFRKPPS
jgi:hypothetical protein